jgi:hypothetical protein
MAQEDAERWHRRLTVRVQSRIPGKVTARVHRVVLVISRHGVAELDSRGTHAEGAVRARSAVPADGIA